MLLLRDKTRHYDGNENLDKKKTVPSFHDYYLRIVNIFILSLALICCVIFAEIKFSTKLNLRLHFTDK